MSLATIVKGNTFSLAIPLQVYAVEDGEVVLRDYTPESGDDITIRLKGDRRNYTYIPSTNGNIAYIHLEGSEVVGVYAVEIEIVKDDDSKLSSMRFGQLSIVESIDELSEGQITEGIEQGAIYLDPEIFIAGKDGRGIVSIVKTATSGLVDTYTITYTDNTTRTYQVTNGEDGAQGVGIANIEKTSTQGLVDTYTITMTDGTTYTFTVTNGSGGGGSQVQADWAETDPTADDYIKNKPSLATVATSGSYNDLLNKPTIPAAQVQSDWNEADSSSKAYILNKPTIPTVPTNVSAFTNDANYTSIPFVTIDTRKTTYNTYDTICGNGNGISLTNGQLLLVFINVTMISGDYALYLNIDQSHGYPATANKAVNYLSTTSGQSSAKCKDFPHYARLLLQYNGSMWVIVASGTAPIDISGKQDTLVSGTNIKSINSASILSSGNLDLLTPNYCPILADTRTSVTGTITADAPFATLEDGQKIIIKLAYSVNANAAIQLTLSGGSTTAAIELWGCNKTESHRLSSGSYRTGAMMECVYSQTDNKWWVIGMLDSDTINAVVSYTDISTESNFVRQVTGKVMHDNCYIVEADGHTTPPSSLDPNKIYDFGEVSSALTIPDPSADNGDLTGLIGNALNFYALRFIAGADNISITFPTGVVVDDEPTINTGDYVEIMINLYVENSTNHFYASIKVWQAQ